VRRAVTFSGYFISEKWRGGILKIIDDFSCKAAGLMIYFTCVQETHNKQGGKDEKR